MGEEFTKVIEEILNFVGSKENILSVGKSKTRLRLNLKDKNKVDVGQFKKVDEVLGIVETKDQFQIILKPQKATVLIQEFIRVIK